MSSSMSPVNDLRDRLGARQPHSQVQVFGLVSSLWKPIQTMRGTKDAGLHHRHASRRLMNVFGGLGSRTNAGSRVNDVLGLVPPHRF